MTPQQHLDRAEELLATHTTQLGEPWDMADSAYVYQAIAHALIAVAVELGAPHVSGDTAAASGG